MGVDRVAKLIEQGVRVPFPEQVAVADDVDPARIAAGAVLHPGARLEGSRLLIGPDTEVGSEGSARVRNCALGRGVKLASGSFEDSVFLDGAQFGPSGHARVGTLFEEQASAAHAVGTKQTILLAWGTLGSNINCCDAMLTGGTSSRDHSEIGSGFIHFNFTPFGPRGDKATASLFGGVPRGVWYREARIFLGGAGGVVGPVQIGFGTVLAAGSVFRKDRDEDRLVYAEALPAREVRFDPRMQRRSRAKLVKNLTYMGHLEALRAWYEAVRLPLAGDDVWQRELVTAAIELLHGARRERTKQLLRFIDGLSESLDLMLRSDAGASAEALDQRRLLEAAPELERLGKEGLASATWAPLKAAVSAHLPAGTTDLIPWVRALSPATVEAGTQALTNVVGVVLAWEPSAD